MTVCVAAICQHIDSDNPLLRWPMIVGASDRQYTLGDGEWTYEPPQTKHYPFSPLADQVVALISGSLSENLEICHAAAKRLQVWPTLDVADIAQYQADAFANYRKMQAERHVLAPLGLTLDGLLTDPRLSDTTAAELREDLKAWRLEDESIIAGFDANGTARLFQVSDPGWATCEDAPGYVAIGSGANHAMAQFMHHQYTREWSTPRALLMVYSAKKRAEVDAYVGKETDLFVIGPGKSIYSHVNPALTKAIEDVYDKAEADDRERFEQVNKQFEEVVNAYFKEQRKAAEQPPEVQGSAEDHAEGLSDGPKEGEPKD